MPSAVDVSIVIPAYNEETRIGPTLERIVRYFKERNSSFEIVVVDDGSQDNTAQVAVQQLNGISYQVLKNATNRGKGFSVRSGVLASKGDVVLFADSDLSTPIEDFEKLELALHDGHDVAIGSRALPSSDVQIHQNALRELMGKTFNVIARLLSFQGIHDSQCGFKAFKQKAAKALFECQKLDGFCFDAEILFLAQKMGYRVQEVGVRWRNSPKSKVHIFLDPIKMFWDLFRIRWLHRGETF
jgi:dolichyl-phosphate beta-glucosyltransferase